MVGCAHAPPYALAVGVMHRRRCTIRGRTARPRCSERALTRDAKQRNATTSLVGVLLVLYTMSTTMAGPEGGPDRRTCSSPSRPCSGRSGTARQSRPAVTRTTSASLSWLFSGGAQPGDGGVGQHQHRVRRVSWRCACACPRHQQLQGIVADALVLLAAADQHSTVTISSCGCGTTSSRWSRSRGRPAERQLHQPDRSDQRHGEGRRPYTRLETLDQSKPWNKTQIQSWGLHAVDLGTTNLEVIIQNVDGFQRSRRRTATLIGVTCTRFREGVLEMQRLSRYRTRLSQTATHSNHTLCEQHENHQLFAAAVPGRRSRLRNVLVCGRGAEALCLYSGDETCPKHLGRRR